MHMKHTNSFSRFRRPEFDVAVAVAMTWKTVVASESHIDVLHKVIL